MKITDQTTPTGGMTEERARELLETPGTVYVEDAEVVIVDDEGGATSLADGCRFPNATVIDHQVELWREGHIHFRSAELILRDFVEGEG